MTTTAQQKNALTTLEQQELEHHEASIERGLQTFLEVGSDLMAIRDARLYREQYRTFGEYCRERWGFEKSRTYQLIHAAKVIENLETSTIVEVLPVNEAQARPLAPLEPEQQRQVWQQVVETVPDDGKITAAHVERVVQEMTTPEGSQETRPCSVSKMTVHFSSETDEHYTPQEIIDAVLELMGAIDLDPCSNNKEQPNVPAIHHYTAEEDGLVQEWHGRVYMNPPYGRVIEQWVEKLCTEHEAGRVTEAIALVPARTDTQWWIQLRDYAVCLIEGRLKFSGDNSAPFPSAVFYLGNHIDRFYYAFCHLGDVWQRIEPGMFGE